VPNLLELAAVVTAVYAVILTVHFV